MSVVVDASALVELLLRRPAARAVGQILSRETAYAPDLVDAEMLSALCRHERAGGLSASRARAAIRAASRAPVRRVANRTLLEDARRRLGNLSACDALYVALAARLGCPLVTADRRLASAPGLDVTVVLVQT